MSGGRVQSCGKGVLLAAWLNAASCGLVSLLAPCSALAEGTQTLVFQFAAPNDVVLERVHVELDRLGEAVVVPMTDDGTVRGDAPWDGVYIGRHEGDYARYVSVRLFGRRSGGESELLYAGVERTPDRRLVQLGWGGMREGQSLLALRSAVAYPGNRMRSVEGLHIVVGFGWALLVLCYVGFLVVARRRKDAS